MFVPVQDLHLPISISRAVDDSAVCYTVFEGERIVMVDSGGPASNAGAIREATLGDIYRITSSGKPLSLRGRVMADGHTIQLTSDTEWGNAGETLVQRRTVTVMDEAAQCCDVLVWSVIGSDGLPYRSCMVPLGPVRIGEAYTIIAASSSPARDKTALMRASGIAEGTMVTTPNGAFPVEELRAGDLVETARGHRRLRWVGATTVRASGPFAPIRVQQRADHRVGTSEAASARATGFLNGSGKPRRTTAMTEVRVLPSTPILCPKTLSAQNAPVLIPASELPENTRPAPDAFEFIDYHTLLFDRPEIIYANGIGVESLRVSPVTLALLPPTVLSGMGTAL